MVGSQVLTMDIMGPGRHMAQLQGDTLVAMAGQTTFHLGIQAIQVANSIQAAGTIQQALLHLNSQALRLQVEKARPHKELQVPQCHKDIQVLHHNLVQANIPLGPSNNST